MEPFFLISDSDLSSSRRHISFSCRNTNILAVGEETTNNTIRFRGHRDRVPAMKRDRDSKRFGQARGLNATLTGTNKSLRAAPRLAGRHETFGGRR